MAQILVVDDDTTVREVVVSYLRAAGHTTDEAGDGETGLHLFGQKHHDLVVLDLMLPGIDGLETCRRIRAASRVPVVMLTALDQERDRVSGLELGSDDYVVKPFSPRELVLRIDSILRRVGESQRPTQEVLTDDDLVLDTARHEVTRAGAPLAVTSREFDLLRHLMRHPHEALARDDLLREVWGWSFGDDSTITVHVRRLREKIEPDPTNPTRLVTVWGVGYRWVPQGGGGDE